MGGQRGPHDAATPDDGGVVGSGNGKDAGRPRCTDTTCDAHATCDDTSGTPTCTCSSGYAGDGKSCADIDECATDNGGCGVHEICANVNGSFNCSCAPGYSKGAGGQCTGLCDAALADSSVCGSNARCTVQKAGAVCAACLPGYTGDGHTCTDHRSDCPSACNGGSGGDDNAVCVGVGNRFVCACASGYSGSPGSCKNVDECAAGSDACDPSAAQCMDTEGGFFCACNAGYELKGTDCADIDECADSTLYTCPKNAACVNDPGTYHCGCTGDFKGDDPASCYCDLSGYWAMRQDLTQCWDKRTLNNVDFVSAGAMQATVWELHKYTYDGSTIKVEKKGCGEDNTPDLITPLFGTPPGEVYSSYLPDATFFGLPLAKGKDIFAPGVVPDIMFTTPNEAAVAGIDLGPNPEVASWPLHSTDINAPGGAAPAWVDTDGDGQAGLTLWPRLPIDATDPSTQSKPAHYSYLPVHLQSDYPTTNDGTNPDARAGCVSVATRFINKLDADVETCTKITGDVVNVMSEGRVHSCLLVPMPAVNTWATSVTCNPSDWPVSPSDARYCTSDNLQVLDDQDQSQRSQATFELVKIGGLGDTPPDCAAVRRALPAITRGATSPVACPF
jgi:hypothetical protein